MLILTLIRVVTQHVPNAVKKIMIIMIIVVLYVDRLYIVFINYILVNY